MERITEMPAMTTREVASRLQLPQGIVLYELCMGRLRGEHSRDGWRITEQGLQEFLEERVNISSAAWHRWLGGDVADRVVSFQDPSKDSEGREDMAAQGTQHCT